MEDRVLQPGLGTGWLFGAVLDGERVGSIYSTKDAAFEAVNGRCFLCYPQSAMRFKSTRPAMPICAPQKNPILG